jgi:hypothetical protein
MSVEVPYLLFNAFVFKNCFIIFQWRVQNNEEITQGKGNEKQVINVE